jgi:phosphate:Na+ symporter
VGIGEALGGLALFLMGQSQAASALQGLGGSSFRRLLVRATGRVERALAVGTFLSLFVQSGSALIASAISLIEAGILGPASGLSLSVGAILGATAALQLVAFHVYALALPMIALGYALSLVPFGRRVGPAIGGIGLLFFGLELLTQAFAGLQQSPLFRLLLGSLESTPALGFLLGLGFAALVQSANATAALALALVSSGAAGLPLGVAMVLGGNAAAPLPALWVALRGGTAGRRVAYLHLLFKLALAVLGVLALPWLVALVRWLGGDPAREIADAHTFFNLVAAFAIVPLARPLARWGERLWPERGGTISPKYLSEEALGQPEIAFSLALREVVRIGDQVLKMATIAQECLSQGQGGAEEIAYHEDKVDRLTHAVVLYLAQLYPKGPSERSMNLLLLANELEHLGDLWRHLLKQQDKLQASGLEFSREGRGELVEAVRKVRERLQQALTALATARNELAEEVLQGRSQMEETLRSLRQAHLARLADGRPESQASSSAHLDMLATLDAIDAGVSRVAELTPRIFA